MELFLQGGKLMVLQGGCGICSKKAQPEGRSTKKLQMVMFRNYIHAIPDGVRTSQLLIEQLKYDQSTVNLWNI